MLHDFERLCEDNSVHVIDQNDPMNHMNINWLHSCY